MKISPKDLVRLIVESNNQGYNQAVKHADRNYDEFSADFRDAIKRAQDEADERTAEAYEKGRREALSDEALAKAKSQAYERGHQRGLAEGEARAENTYNSGLEAGVKAERERAEAQEPKLSVWFRPCGPVKHDKNGNVIPGPVLADKIKAIKAIRQAYTHAEGYGLKEVKDMVEVESFGARYAAGQPLPQSKAVELYLKLQEAGFDPVLRAQD